MSHAELCFKAQEYWGSWTCSTTDSAQLYVEHLLDYWLPCKKQSHVTGAQAELKLAG